MLRLSRPGANLPLGFEAIEHLTGKLTPFYGGQGGHYGPLVAGNLDQALYAEGIGLKPIRISGQFAATPGGALQPWQTTIEVAGHIDHQSLARLIHAASRQFTEASGEAGRGTIPELYVTQIDVGEPGAGDVMPPEPPGEGEGEEGEGLDLEEIEREQKKRRPPKRRRKLVKVIRYRDRKTGRLVKASTWKRSKAHLKGRPGRYVREITTEKR